MQIETITTEAAWAEIAEPWNNLLEQSITKVPFLRYEYLRAWWQYRGGGEWPDAQLFIIVGREEGEIKGIAPCFLVSKEPGHQALMLLGSIEISDFLDLIAAPEDLDDFLDAMFGYLASPQAPDWRCLDWYNLLKESASLPALEAVAEKHGFSYRQDVYLPSPIIELPSDFDQYVAGLDKKYRHEFRRKMRNAAGFFLPVEWYVVEDGDLLEQEFNQFGSLMRQEREKDVFLTDEMVKQMAVIAKAFFEMGILRLSFLKVGNEYAAGYFNLDYDDKIWVYNSGMNKKFSELSPGIVLTGFLMMDAIEQDKTAFDMMRGAEDYKYHLGGTDRHVMRVTVDR